MKFRILFFYIFIASLLFSTHTFAAEEKLLDKVVAIVNSQVITQSELDQQMQVDVAQSHAKGLQLHLRQQALDQLINIALQKNIAKKANIKISDAQVSAAISKIAAQNNMSLAQLQKSVATQGMSYSAYRHQIHDQMLISEVQHLMVAPKVKVTPEDIAAAKESAQSDIQPQPLAHTKALYHVVDILVLNPDNAENLLSKIRSSGNPGAILNNNPAVKISDLGFRRLSDLPSIFVKPTESLNPGQFSDLIKAPNGVHIISLIAIQGGGNRALILTPQQIAYQKKFAEALQKWLRTLRSESYIKIIN